MAHTCHADSERFSQHVLGRLKFTRGPVDKAVFCAAAIGTTMRTTAARRIATGTTRTTATTTTGFVACWGVSQVCGPEWRPSRWPAACPESPNRIPVLPRAKARETNAIVAPAGPCSHCPGRGIERLRPGVLAAHKKPGGDRMRNKLVGTSPQMDAGQPARELKPC